MDSNAAYKTELHNAAGRARLTGRVTVIESTMPFAFTHGLLFPRVAISSGLVTLATERELTAVLAHEAKHVRSRDPLRALIAGLLTAHHFTLPLLGHLRAGFAVDRELAADRQAVARCGTSAVAGALLKVSDMPDWAVTAPISGMGATELFDARITRLEAGLPPRPAPPARWRVAVSLAGIAAYAWLLAGSVVLIGATPLSCMPG
ncbi:M56 family metallopeptidase [Streptomyces sp. NPDC058092]|uniref:M56 family metallopeptidase n=1 Tax=Streptomyces sp. NPDC058092 TaxID=3346336 RepID=UPI0036EBC271